LPFLPEVAKVPDYTACTNDNKCGMLKAKNALVKKTPADIVTMNAALTDIFLDKISTPSLRFISNNAALGTKHHLHCPTIKDGA
jgi:hypothetical protein